MESDVLMRQEVKVCGCDEEYTEKSKAEAFSSSAEGTYINTAGANIQVTSFQQTSITFRTSRVSEY